MRYFHTAIQRGVVSALILAFASQASADATSAWGTSGSSGGSGGVSTASAIMHRSQGELAQIATIGRNISTMYRSNSSCGSCIYYQIEGDDNTISSNDAISSNTGSITSNAEFK